MTVTRITFLELQDKLEALEKTISILENRIEVLEKENKRNLKPLDISGGFAGGSGIPFYYFMI